MGYDTKIINVGIDEEIPDFDIMLIGGGQDREMRIIASDARRKSSLLNYYIEKGKTILAICGGYQLLGDYYKTDDDVIKLTGALPFYTVSNDFRMIGNTVYDTEFGTVVGFENHSGRTFLCKDLQSLGSVLLGYGNNGIDNSEGILYKNTFCTYSHGPVLPKNPKLADEIIRRAVGDVMQLDDEIEQKCHNELLNIYYK